MRRLVPELPQVRLWGQTRPWKTVNTLLPSSKDLKYIPPSKGVTRGVCSSGRWLSLLIFHFQNEKWGTEGLVKNHGGRSEKWYLALSRPPSCRTQSMADPTSQLPLSPWTMCSWFRIVLCGSESQTVMCVIFAHFTYQIWISNIFTCLYTCVYIQVFHVHKGQILFIRDNSWW